MKVTDLCDFVDRHPRLFVLTGAGMSTDSGSPGYRNADGLWQRSPPVLLKDFLRSESTRQRYWARSLMGWPMVANARPNAAHTALARLEAEGCVQQLVTQNVDGLHQRAGSEKLIELHGNLAVVVCLDCGGHHSRETVQRELEAQNGSFGASAATTAPDGDADLQCVDLAAFQVPSCSLCGGMLKPDVVFFGEGVPRERVASASLALERADAMLVIGSSLMVYSGYRFCEQAHTMGKPIAAINLGRTRGDHLLALKVERSCADALGSMVERLSVSTTR